MRKSMPSRLFCFEARVRRRPTRASSSSVTSLPSREKRMLSTAIAAHVDVHAADGRDVDVAAQRRESRVELAAEGRTLHEIGRGVWAAAPVARSAAAMRVYIFFMMECGLDVEFQSSVLEQAQADDDLVPVVAESFAGIVFRERHGNPDRDALDDLPAGLRRLRLGNVVRCLVCADSDLERDLRGRKTRGSRSS